MRFALFCLATCLLLVLAGCAAQSNDMEDIPDGNGKVANFWLGLWHGTIAPVTLVISVFNHDVGVYDIHNNGGWYDLGFLLALIAIWGGGGKGSSKIRGRRSRRT